MSTRTIRILVIVGVVALGGGLVACGDDDTDTTDDADEATAEDDTADEDEPTLVVTPDSGLADGDVVTLEASGFTPGLVVGITQCADADDPAHGIEGSTSSAECDLGAIQSLDIADDGTATAEYAVSGGPFGEAQIVCDADHDCVLSIGELSPDPDVERATVTITFG